MRMLFLTLALGIVFVLATDVLLPPIVASHFVAGGAANGFMPRSSYLRFTIVLLAGLPLLIAFLSSLATLLPSRFINLPNREYWLAPEREDETLSYIRKQGYHFGELLVIFLCFIHWLVIRANSHNPPLFPESLFFIGLATFLVGLVALLARFVSHFRRYH